VRILENPNFKLREREKSTWPEARMCIARESSVPKKIIRAWVAKWKISDWVVEWKDKQDPRESKECAANYWTENWVLN